MENKTKTIEEIAEEVDENFYRENNYYQSTCTPIIFAIKVGIEASKYHVTEALKQSYQKAKLKEQEKGDEQICFMANDIDDAYPLNNIK